MEKEKVIEKAHQVGDAHPSKPWVWTEYKPGKFDWRPVKNGGASGASSSSSTKKEDDDESKNKQDSAAANAGGSTDSAQGTEEAPKSTAYKPKAPKGKYTAGPKVEIDVPAHWKIKKPNGKIVDVDRANIIKMLEGKTDDEIIAWVNTNNRAWKYRQLGWDEALSRGIDESKLDPSGTLQDEWDKAEELAKNIGKVDDEEEGEEEDYELNLRGFDIDAFMKEFPNGDEGWRDKNDKRVRKWFNNLNTLVDRQKYDAFLDYQKRQDENYETPVEVVQSLNADYLTFLDTDLSPLFISSGGAGVGKTYGLGLIAKARNYKFMDEDQDPTDGDWTIVKCPNPKSEKEFYEILKKYNGHDDQGRPHVLVFDDNDAILTDKAYRATMKTIADTDPKSRLFKDEESGKMVNFTGKILIITNKQADDIIEAAGAGAEDVKAVLSRASKADIQFTVNENLEILGKRYKNMQISGLNMTPEQEKRAREEVYKFIVTHKDKLDPAKFTVRKFREVMVAVQKQLLSQQAVQDDPTLKDVVGSGKAWQKNALSILNKAEEDLDIEKAEKSTDAFSRKMKELPEETKKAMAQIKKEHPEIYAELWGDKALEILNKDEDDLENAPKSEKKKKEKEIMEDEDVAEKALFNDMSIDEAEEILLG